MNLLQNLLGGGSADEHRDFVNRYDQGGDPTTGYSMPEALQRYRQVVPNLSPEQFQQAAQQSFANMSPDLRNQFGQILQQQAQQHGLNVPNLMGASPEQFQSPNYLSQITGNLHNQGFLNTILGGALSGAAGGFSHGGVQGALGGAESGAMGGAQSGGLGSMLGGLAGGNQGFSGGSGIDNSAGGMAGNFAENAVGSMGGIFGSPAVKAAIGGIAANAVRGILQQHGL